MEGPGIVANRCLLAAEKHGHWIMDPAVLLHVIAASM